MCDPVTAGLIITAVSGTAGAVNQNQAFRRQDKQAAEGIRRQSALSRQAGARVDAQIADVAGATGEEQRAEALDGFLNSLRTARGSTEGALDPIAAANPRFAERVSGGKADVARAGIEKAGRLARIDAPLRLRQSEADDFRSTAGDLRGISQESDIERFLTQLRVSSERPNEFVEALTGVGKGVGSVLSLGAGGLPNFLKGGTSLNKLAKAGGLVDAPVNPFILNPTTLVS